MELLAKLPLERWAERDENGFTLLHHAALGGNVTAAVALVQSGLVDVDGRNRDGYTPAHCAAWMQPRVMEALCAAGANLRARNRSGFSPIDHALLFGHSYDFVTVGMLMANGTRLSTVHEHFRRYITPKLVAFERGILRCRSAVAAMLRVKRAGQLWRWDKFLLREVALAIWARRYNESWSSF